VIILAIILTTWDQQNSSLQLLLIIVHSYWDQQTSIIFTAANNPAVSDEMVDKHVDSGQGLRVNQDKDQVGG
jgi:hypothetical protein